MNNTTAYVLKSFKQFFLLLILTGLVSMLFSNCATPNPSHTMPDGASRKMILRDEGLSQLTYVDLTNPKNNWYVPVPAGRDLQLVGQGLVLIGTGTGYEERNITTGHKVFELTSFNGTLGARRLRNGNTLLTGLNWQGKKGIVLVEVDKNGSIKRLINYPAYNYVRMVRETVAGTFLLTADDVVLEGNAAGKILWQAKLTSREKPHAWQAQRLANGHTLVSGGYTANFQVFDASGKLVSTITGPADVNPSFYAGFQILANGNYVVANWQGHGPKLGSSGTQVLEYNPSGQLVWSWKQDPAKFSSIQGVLVLDGLNLKQLHSEDARGVLVAVKP